jgi:hypothetical protein
LVNRCTPITVRVTGPPQGCNVTFAIEPLNTTYHVNSSVYSIEIYRLLAMTFTLDSGALYGPFDFIGVNVTTVDPVTTGALVLTPTTNDTFTASPASLLFDSASPTSQLALISWSPSFETDGPVPRLLSFNLTGSDVRATYYDYPTSVTIAALPAKSITLVDTAPLGNIYVGTVNRKSVSVTLSQIPKPDRILNVSVVLQNATNASAVHISPDYLVFNASTPLTQIVTVDTTSPCLFELSLWENAESTAVEYRPYSRLGNLSFESLATVPIAINALPASIRVLRKDSFMLVRFSTDSYALMAGERITLNVTANPASAVDIVQAASFTSILRQASVTANITAASTLIAPVNVTFNFTMSVGPPNFGPLLVNQITVLVAPRLNVTVLFPGSKFHINPAPDNAYPIDITVPPLGNDYPNPNITNQGLIMTVACLNGDLASRFRVGTRSGPLLPPMSLFNNATTTLRIDYEPVFMMSDRCTFSFRSNETAMYAEYSTLSFVFQTTVNDRRLLGFLAGSVSPANVYDGALLQYSVGIPDKAAIAPFTECDEGKTLNATLVPSPQWQGLVANYSASMVVTSAMTTAPLLNFTHGITVGPLNVSVPTVLGFNAYPTGSTCYAALATTVEITTVKVYPADKVFLWSFPSESYLETPQLFSLELNPTIMVPGDGDVVIRIDWLGPAGAVSITGPTVQNAAPGPNVSTWVINVPRPGPPPAQVPGSTGPQRVSANLTGVYPTNGNRYGFRCTGVGDASVAFNGCNFTTSPDTTQVRNLVAAEIMSQDNPTVNTYLRTLITDAGGVTLFQNETFTLMIYFASAPPNGLRITPVFDNATYRLDYSDNITTSGSYTRIFHFVCYNTTYNQTETNMLGSGERVYSISPIRFKLEQSQKLFSQPASVPIRVKHRVLITSTDLPSALRVGAQNSLTFWLSPQNTPTRETLNVTFDVDDANENAVRFVPPYLAWTPGESAPRNVTIIGGVANPSVSVTVTTSTDEFLLPLAFTGYKLRVLALGTIQVTNARPSLFKDQSAVLQLTPDYTPIAKNLSVSVEYSLPNAVSFDYSIDGPLFWPMGEGNRTRNVELFADQPTHGVSYPITYIITSTEFDRIVCDDCDSLRIIMPSNPQVFNATESVTRIIFVDGTYSFQIEVPECEQSVIIATPLLVDKPDAVTWTPEFLRWDCTNATRGAIQTLNVTGKKGENGRDPLGRASTIELDVKESLAGAPDSLRPVAISAKLEVRAPVAIGVEVTGPQYFGTPLSLFASLTRLPAAGDLYFTIVAKGLDGVVLNSVNISAPLRWRTANDRVDGQLSSLTQQAMIDQLDTSFHGKEMNLTFILSGASAREYTLPFSWVRILTLNPVTVTADRLTTVDMYRGIWYSAFVELEEPPEEKDTYELAFASTRLDGEATGSDTIEFSPTTVKFIGAKLQPAVGAPRNVSMPFRFRTSVPGTYTISFVVPPTSVELPKFNKVVDAKNLTRFRVLNSIGPSVTPLKLSTQFMLERNAQTFAVAIPSAPATDQLLQVVPELVSPVSPYTATLAVEFKPASADFTNKVVSGSLTERTFSVYSAGRVAIDAAALVGPYDVWVNFATNRTTAHFNTTRLYVGRIYFQALHYVYAPPQLVYDVYVGRQLPTIPVVTSGIPPAYANSQAEYAIGLSIPTVESTGAPAFAVFPTVINIGKNGSTDAGFFTVTALAVSGASNFTLRYSSETRLALAPSFDTIRTREYAMTVLVRPLFRASIVAHNTDRILSTANDNDIVTLYVGENNAIMVDFYLPQWSAESDASKLTLSLNLTNAWAAKAEIDSTDINIPNEKVVPAVRRVITITGLLSTDNITNSNNKPRLTVIMSGSGRVSPAVSIRLDVLRLHRYSVVKAPPASIFAGAGNAATFSVLPLVNPTQTLRLEPRFECNGVQITPNSFTWNNSAALEPAVFTIQYAIGTSATETDCAFSIRQGVLSTATRFEDIAMDNRVTLVPAPQLTLRVTDEGYTDGLVSGEHYRAAGIGFRLLLEYTTFVDEKNLTIGTDPETAAILVNSTLNSTDSATGFMSLFAAESDKSRFFTISLLSQRNIITVTMPAVKTYRTFVGERLYFRLMPRALLNATVPHAHLSTPYFDLGADNREPPTRTERQALEATAFSAAAISGLASLASATQVGRVLAIGSMSDCPSQNWVTVQNDMPVYIAPISVGLGSNDDLGGYAGAAVSNVLLCSICMLIHYGIAQALHKLRGSGHRFEDASATVYFPSLGTFPVMLLYQTTLTSSALLLLYSPRPEFKVLGSIVFLLFGVVIPTGMVSLYNRTSQLTYLRPLRRNRRDWLFSRGTYTHPTDESWVRRFNLPFHQLRFEKRWFFLFDLAVIAALGIVTAVQPKNAQDCIGRSAAAMLIFVAQFVVVALVKPFSAMFDNIFFATGYIVQLAAMGVIFYSSLNGTDFEAAYEMSGRILLGFAVMLAIKAFVDWWRLLASGLTECSFDPGADRTFKAAASKQADTGVHTFFGKDAAEEFERGLLEMPGRVRHDVPIGDIACTTTSYVDGRPELLTGFRRSMDPGVAALSGPSSRVATASVERGAGQSPDTDGWSTASPTNGSPRPGRAYARNRYESL